MTPSGRAGREDYKHRLMVLSMAVSGPGMADELKYFVDMVLKHRGVIKIEQNAVPFAGDVGYPT